MNPKDILLAWASQYKNCAVNYIPTGTIVDLKNVLWEGRHIRFQDGEPDGILSDHDGYNQAFARYFHIERTATYYEVLAEMECEEPNISTPNLEEVL